MAKKNILNQSKLKKAQKAIDAGKLNDAEKILIQLCKRDSVEADTWVLLASVYGRMNNFQAVGESCMKALAIEANNTTALNYLGNVYSAGKQYDKAVECYTKSLKTNPDEISTLFNLASLLYKQQDIDKALKLYQRIIDLKFDHFEALIKLTQIYTDKGYFNLATKYCERLNSLHPNNYELLFQLARCYIHTVKIDQARETLEKAIKYTRTPANAYLSLANNELHSSEKNNLNKSAEYLTRAIETGTALEKNIAYTAEANIWHRQGDSKKAHKRLNQLIDNGYFSKDIIIIYASLCRKFDDCDYVVKLGEKRLKAEKQLPNDQRGVIHYCIGKILDKEKKYNDAFTHYQKANALETLTYNDKTEIEFTNSIINAYSSDNYRQLDKSTLDTKLPVFIIGMPRSGTSLTEQILASHHQVYGAGELQELGSINSSFILPEFDIKGQLHDIANKLNSDQLNATAQHYLNTLKSYSNTALRVTDKMPQNFIYLGFITQLFPHAKIIHCTRHPLDTILSIYFQGFTGAHHYASNLKDIAHYYRQYQRMMNHWKETLDIPIYEVSYSNMVNDFENTCKGLVGFTDLEWDKNCLNFYKSGRTVVTASIDQVRSPIYTSSLNRWKHYETFLEPLKSEFSDYFEQ